MPTAPREQIIEAMAQAIAKEEGFYTTEESARARGIRWPTLAQRNLNPGNLRAGTGAVIVDGYARFAVLEDGWRALRRLIRKNIETRRLTFHEFFAGKPGVYAGYAPASDGNRPRSYAERVASAVARIPSLAGADIGIDTLILSLIDAPAPEEEGAVTG